MSEKDENMEQSFNDAELQDIMNEIESLEKEFVEEEGAPQGEAETVEAKTEEPSAEHSTEETQTEEPQAQQEETQDDEDNEDFSSEAESYEAEEETSNVVPMSAGKAQPTAPTAGGEGYMQFSGQGDMDMQLNFQLGEETATVNIKDGCLNVTLAGVQLELSENGCEVHMDGGVKFSVPLTGSQAKGKKAA